MQIARGLSENRLFEVYVSEAASTVTVLVLLPSRERQASLRAILWHPDWKRHFIETPSQEQVPLGGVTADVVIRGRWLRGFRSGNYSESARR